MEWASRQGRQSPSKRAPGRPGRPQSVHSMRMRRAGAELLGWAFSVGSRGGILSTRRRRTKPRGLGGLGVRSRCLVRGALVRYGEEFGGLFRTRVFRGGRRFLGQAPERRERCVGRRDVRCGVRGQAAVLGGEAGVPPLVVAGGAGPEGAVDPAGFVARAGDGAPYASQVPGDGEGVQGGGDGLLPVERVLFGQLLHAHRGIPHPEARVSAPELRAGALPTYPRKSDPTVPEARGLRLGTRASGVTACLRRGRCAASRGFPAPGVRRPGGWRSR